MKLHYQIIKPSESTNKTIRTKHHLVEKEKPGPHQKPCGGNQHKEAERDHLHPPTKTPPTLRCRFRLLPPNLLRFLIVWIPQSHVIHVSVRHFQLLLQNQLIISMQARHWIQPKKNIDGGKSSPSNLLRQEIQEALKKNLKSRCIAIFSQGELGNESPKS